MDKYNQIKNLRKICKEEGEVFEQFCMEKPSGTILGSTLITIKPAQIPVTQLWVQVRRSRLNLGRKWELFVSAATARWETELVEVNFKTAV